MNDQIVTASAYLVIKADRSGVRDPETGLRGVWSAKIIQSRQSRTSLGPDEVLIKVAVQIPKAAFDPIIPQALVIVPENLILGRHEIEVEATEDGSEQ